MTLSVISKNVSQPDVISYKKDNVLTVAIAGLALGGAEKIVLDWAIRIYPKWRVHIIVLRDHDQEWPVPEGIKITRLHNQNVLQKLERIGQRIVKSSGNTTVLCHLLQENERNALARFGAITVPVLHNAQQGWMEGASAVSTAPYVVSVSEACKNELGAALDKRVSVIRHIPQTRRFANDARNYFRTQWQIPLGAKVIGMVGAVKSQKNYEFAMSILKELNLQEPVYLVILGGPIGKNGKTAWQSVIQSIYEQGVRHRVAMPGFVPDAMKCLPAFDVLLNTSHYEGFSMATTEAVIHGMPVVASNVGGQNEMKHDRLILVDKNESVDKWVDTITSVIGLRHETPSWTRFPAYRLWTLAGLAKPYVPDNKTLFVTANLNSGGAQRSLVNLATSLGDSFPYEVVVTGNSSADHFFNQLTTAGVRVMRSAETRDAFDHAEILVKKIVTERIKTVCFWNLDSKVKLLLVKTLAFTDVAFVDVSPGNNSFDELEDTREFRHMIAFSEAEYYTRLNKLVLKYHGPAHPLCKGKTEVIPNGIPIPLTRKHEYSVAGNPRIVVNGRITPTKFIKEIIQSMDYVWQSIPNAELHFYGAAESKCADYAAEVALLAGPNTGTRIFFHGMTFNAKDMLHQYDAYAVLGKDQGCPNALLEALSVGLPAVGNDDGGTNEQIIDGKTGILINSCDPYVLGEALILLLTNRVLAESFGKAARAHVTEKFSMSLMAARYSALFTDKKPVRWRSVTKKQLMTSS